MQDINVKGHKKHLEWRMNVLSSRKTQGWSANKITSQLWNCCKFFFFAFSFCASFCTLLLILNKLKTPHCHLFPFKSRQKIQVKKLRVTVSTRKTITIRFDPITDLYKWHSKICI